MKKAKPDVAIVPDSDPTHALEALAKQVGDPNPKLLAGFLAGTSDERLIDTGRTIDTKRIVTDATRIYGEALAWWKSASPADHKLVRGVSRDLLAIAVHRAVELESLRASIEDSDVLEVAQRAELGGSATVATGGALSLRDQAYDALRDAAGQDVGLGSAVKATVGTAENADALARGIEGLSTLLRDWLKRKDSGLAARLSLANLDEDYADELAKVAKGLREKEALREKGKRSRLNQGALDREDGVNVLLLGQILRGFDAAHSRNPTIPKLVPISTRRLFNRKTAKPAEATKPDAPVVDGTK